MALINLIKSHDLSFQGKSELSPQIYEFRFKPTEPLSWLAGQYAIFTIPLIKNKVARKSLSISSAPGESTICLTTRIPSDDPSPFKKGLLALKKGAQVKIRGPFGPMHIDDPAKQYALIATGIGIAPFIAIFKQLIINGQLDTKITLFYLSSSGGHLYKEQLSEFKQSLKNLNIQYVYKPDRITGQLLEDVLGKDLHDNIYFLSGSNTAVKSFKRTVIGLKVERSGIKHNPSFLSQPKVSKEFITNKIKRI